MGHKVLFCIIGVVPICAAAQIDQKRAAADFAKFGIICRPDQVKIGEMAGPPGYPSFPSAQFERFTIGYRDDRIASFYDGEPDKAEGNRLEPKELLRRMEILAKKLTPEAAVGKTRYELAGRGGFRGHYFPKHGAYLVDDECFVEMNAKSGKPLAARLYVPPKFESGSVKVTPHEAQDKAVGQLRAMMADKSKKPVEVDAIERSIEELQGTAPTQEPLWSYVTNAAPFRLAYVFKLKRGEVGIDAETGAVNFANIGALKSEPGRILSPSHAPSKTGSGSNGLPLALAGVGGLMVIALATRKKAKAS